MRYMAFIGLIMSVVFIAMGFLVMFYPPAALAGYGATSKYLFGVLIICYGLFRLWRSYNQLKTPQ